VPELYTKRLQKENAEYSDKMKFLQDLKDKMARNNDDAHQAASDKDQVDRARDLISKVPTPAMTNFPRKYSADGPAEPRDEKLWTRTDGDPTFSEMMITDLKVIPDKKEN